MQVLLTPNASANGTKLTVDCCSFQLAAVPQKTRGNIASFELTLMTHCLFIAYINDNKSKC